MACEICSRWLAAPLDFIAVAAFVAHHTALGLMEANIAQGEHVHLEAIDRLIELHAALEDVVDDELSTAEPITLARGALAAVLALPELPSDAASGPRADFRVAKMAARHAVDVLRGEEG